MPGDARRSRGAGCGGAMFGLVLVLAGCGGGAPGTEEVVRAAVGDTLLTARSGAWVPPGSAPVSSGREHRAAERLPGYPVQIFRSLSLVEAETRRVEAERLLGRSVTLEFRAPYYRLTVGNSRTRAEAEALRQELVGRGWEGVTVIEGLVEPE